MTDSVADGVEIRPKLVVKAGSHLCLIQVFKRANRAAATESNDQVVELPNARKKSLQLHGIACVYRVPCSSIADGDRCGRGLVWRASGHPNLRAGPTQIDRGGQTNARSAPDDDGLLLLKHIVPHAHGIIAPDGRLPSDAILMGHSESEARAGES